MHKNLKKNNPLLIYSANLFSENKKACFTKKVLQKVSHIKSQLQCSDSFLAMPAGTKVLKILLTSYPKNF